MLVRHCLHLFVFFFVVVAAALLSADDALHVGSGFEKVTGPRYAPTSIWSSPSLDSEKHKGSSQYCE